MVAAMERDGDSHGHVSQDYMVVKGVYACFPFNKQKFDMEMWSGLLARFYITLMV